MTSTITKDTLVTALQSKIPQFKIDPDWAAGPEGVLGYLIINDLGRYICEQAYWADDEELKRTLEFLELCLENGDSYMRDLVAECLEAVWSCEHVKEIVPHFGPKTQGCMEKPATSKWQLAIGHACRPQTPGGLCSTHFCDAPARRCKTFGEVICVYLR